MGDRADVVIVGGGIAGCALAVLLARNGTDVVVLERQRPYTDRVKGEAMLPWGVFEAKRLDLYDVLVDDAGAHAADRFEVFTPLSGPEGPAVMKMTDLRPDAHVLNFQHPVACQALANAAAAARAHVISGVGKVDVEPGRRPTVTYEVGDRRKTLSCRLVVGADGRNSSVRKQLGLRLRTARGNHHVAGLLVDGLATAPMDAVGVGITDEVFGLSFPQGGGRSRIYACPPRERKGRYSGAGGRGHFLDDVAMPCLPWHGDYEAATTSGPCRTYSGDDTVVDDPRADGVVLIGDAAGYSTPLVGTGLSGAFRDVRLVAEAVADGSDLRPGTFDAYVEERRERMRRLEFIAKTTSTLFVGPGAPRRTAAANLRMAKDASLVPWRVGHFLGPEIPPPDAFDVSIRERLLA